MLGSPIQVDHLLIWHKLQTPLGHSQLHIMEGNNLHQKALLNVIVEATDSKAGIVVILPNALWVLAGLNQDAPGGTEQLWMQ